MKKSLSRKEVAEILGKYDLGEYKSHKPFTKGVVQTNLKVVTTTGVYVIRKYGERSLEYVLCEIELLNHLAEKKFPSQVPYHTNSGKQYVLSHSKPVIVLNYIKGSHISEEKLTRNQLGSLAKTLGTYHTIVKEFKPKHYKKRLHTDEHYIRSMYTTKDGLSKKRKALLKESLEIVDKNLKSTNYPIPKGCIHADYHSGNVLFNKNKLVGVLDFDDSFYTCLIFDLADMVNNYAFRHTFDFNLAKYIIKQYESKRKLTTSEKKYLYDAILHRKLLFAVWTMFGEPKKLRIRNGLTKQIRTFLKIQELGREEFNKKLNFSK